MSQLHPPSLRPALQAGDAAIAYGLACRTCDAPLSELVADLGMSPLSNAYAPFADVLQSEQFFPLVAFVCARCFLVQLPAVETPERIFSHYPFFSSYSDSWLVHTRDFCDEMQQRLSLGGHSQVIEIGSNDGCLLQHFRAAGIPVLGVDPAANVAEVARSNGIETLTAFFGEAVASELAAGGRRADLLVANNVMPHVPDLHDLVSGLKIALAPGGLMTAEFPHLLRLMREGQFDTIYHEHFSYFSVLTIRDVLAAHDLQLVDAEEIWTHGGSLRIHVRHAEEGHRVSPAVARIEQEERAFGLDGLESYRRFASGIRESKRSLLQFLLSAVGDGKRVAGYGAPAKASTLLHYCGVGAELLEYTVDRSPHKQGRFLPGTRIPIHAPGRLAETRPDYVLILPWNLREEITAQLDYVRDWGARLVIPVPRVEILA